MDKSLQFVIVLPQNATMRHHHKVCVAAVICLYKVDTRNAPLKTPVIACHWTSYSVKERYNKNYTSVSTEISINILDN